MPNSWRIMISCMGIWQAANNGDMLKVDELIYLYRLKASKEHGYYELVPWEMRTRIVRGLPSSFRYWKSKCFFVYGDDFETSSSEVWGDLPRLHRWWGTPTLGASLFLSRHLCFAAFTVLATDSLPSCFAQLKDVQNSRAGIKSVCKRKSSTCRLLRARTIWWTHVLWPLLPQTEAFCLCPAQP